MMDKRFLARGKRNNELNNEWVKGYYVDVKSPMIYTGEKMLSGNFDWFDVDPATVGRCTGLIAAKSYRGDSEDDRLVFEGDIVSTNSGTGVIKSKRGYCCFYFEYLDSRDWDAIDEFVESKYTNYGNKKIIGNIHDNPELLGG